MERQLSGKDLENRVVGGKSGQMNGKNVLQQQRGTRQPLGVILNRNELNIAQNIARVQPDRAAKQPKNQQRKPLEPIRHSMYMTHINNNFNKLETRNNKISREPPSLATNNKPTFSVYSDPTPAPLDATMEVEEASENASNGHEIAPIVPIHAMDSDALRELHIQQELAYIRHFPDFEKNKEVLLSQWKQEQQEEQQEELKLLENVPLEQKSLQQQQENVQQLQQQQQQQNHLAEVIVQQHKQQRDAEDIDPNSYSDMEMDREEEEEEEDGVVGEDDDDEGVEVVRAEGVMVDDGAMLLKEYRGDVYKHCRETEGHFQPRPDYMKKQFDLTHPMRAVLIDWMVEVVDEYHMRRETLFLSVNYVDRFLSLMSVIRGKLQLLGAAAMFVAAKFEEIYPPDVAQFVYITDDTYTVKQILQMEQVLLKTLHFSTAPPTCNFFACELLSQLSVRCVSADPDDQWMHLTMYMLEQSLLEGEEFMRYKSSLLASAVVLLSNHLLHDRPCSHKIRQLTGYTIEEMGDCLRSIHASLLKAPTHPQPAIYTKYSSEKFHQVAKLAVPESLCIDVL